MQTHFTCLPTLKLFCITTMVKSLHSNLELNSFAINLLMIKVIQARIPLMKLNLGILAKTHTITTKV
jgi:hypothetical protein